MLLCRYYGRGSILGVAFYLYFDASAKANPTAFNLSLSSEHVGLALADVINVFKNNTIFPYKKEIKLYFS